MKKALLVFPGFAYYAPIGRPPLGIGYIASVLRQNGYDARILDLTLYRDPNAVLEKHFEEYKPEYLMFSVLTTTYPSLRGYMEKARKCESVKTVILGGPHVTADPEGVMKDFPGVIIVRGEGELTIVELMNALEQGKDLSGILGINYISSGELRSNPTRPFMADLSTLPMPAFDLMEVEKYAECLEGKRIVSMVTSRGCPFQCTYCLKATHGRSWVGRSAESIIAEIKYIIKTFDRSAFYFVDDLFTRDEKRVLEFCGAVREEKLDIVWRCLARVDMVSERMIAAMYEAGCRVIDFGVESCDDEILRNIKKGYAYEKVKRAFEWTAKIGMKTKAHMMLALPGDTTETMFRTIDRICSLPADYIQFNITIPFPGTELWTWMIEKGILPKEQARSWEFYQMSNIEQENLTAEEIDKLPIYVPEGFTKRNMFELYMLANGLGKLHEFKVKYRKRGWFGFVLSAGRHPVSLTKALYAFYRYTKFKARFQQS